MSRNLLIYLFASIVLVCTYAQNTGSATNTTSTTLAPTTSNETTTAKPETTTTAKPETTTTVKPNTTTTAKPTPEPTPGPIPTPEQWTGNVTIENNTCISVQFSVQISFKYNNSETREELTGFTIPKNASVNSKNSKCSQNETKPEVIFITFANEEHTSANLTLTFTKTNDSKVIVESIELSFIATSELMPGLDSKYIGKNLKANKNGLTLFKVASDHSYLCRAEQSASLDSQAEPISDVQIKFTDSKVEAYIEKKKGGKFDSEIDCKSADISDVVPIAVGAALAGLVVIVLIAYFIGRRRSRRLAYQSV